MEDIDIDNLLDNWYKTKQEISVLEEKCEKYKKVSTKLMEQIEKMRAAQSGTTENNEPVQQAV